MRYVKCPADYDGTGKSLFIAGGITGCTNWQNNLIKMLDKTNLILFNPRGKKFPINDPKATKPQIQWEHKYLKKATAISFWFAPETLCPITLYELGKQSTKNKKVFIGVHPAYQRKEDVEIQTKLERPEIKIVYSLKDLARQIKEWAT
jgi:predicted transglutaminase-like protease